MVVECHSHTHVMERRGVALQVFYGVGVGMEHVGIAEYLLRCWRRTLYEIVVVCVYAGYHIASNPSLDEAHQHRLLATVQMVGTRWQQYLEKHALVLEVAEHRPPEEYVVVALDVGDNAPPGLLRGKAVGGLYV